MICPHCGRFLSRRENVLSVLKYKDYNLIELAKRLDLTPASISITIKLLEHEGLVKVIREGVGKKILISLNKEKEQ